MKKLISDLRKLDEEGIATTIQSRLRSFKRMGKSSNEQIFKELCFCILAANFDSERTWHLQQQIDNGFLSLSQPQLQRTLKKLGYRYPPNRSQKIVMARAHIPYLKKKVHSFSDDQERREWLVKNIYGMGMKTSSQFLRNIGYTNYAILDFHVIDILARYKLVQRPKTLTTKRYLAIEKRLQCVADKMQMSQAELDFYLFYMETGKIFK